MNTLYLLDEGDHCIREVSHRAGDVWSCKIIMGGLGNTEGGISAGTAMGAVRCIKIFKPSLVAS
jgi:hypothetical protein